MAQDDHLRFPRLFFLFSKGPAEHRLYAEHLEEARSHAHTGHLFGLAAARQVVAASG
jgi:hypothetical protein